MFEAYFNESCLPVLQSELLLREPGLSHFFSLRGSDAAKGSRRLQRTDPYADVNLCDYTGDDEAHVRSCRQAFADAMRLPVSRLWFPRQVHGTEIVEVDFSTPQGLTADAVITRTEGLCVGVSTADCVPVLLYDRQSHAVAAIHAGWRGTVAHIVRQAVIRLAQCTGSDPSSFCAAIGPSISVRAFEVGAEVADAFVSAGFSDCVCHDYVKPHIDLWQANVADLLQAGVALDAIDCSPVCSYENPDRLFSARRLGVHSGRIASCIAFCGDVSSSSLNV